MGNKSSRSSCASATEPPRTTTSCEAFTFPGGNGEPKLEIRPMLVTAQKNFRTVKDCPTIKSCYSPPGIIREELNVPGSRCFLLHSVLTPEECAHYIRETEQVGYADLASLFPVKYRSNDRVLSICKPLVECLWRRIEPFITRREVICIRPVGFGNEGTWKPSRLNECCKFGKYKCGDHFSPHLDGPWVPNEEESSIFTVVIYLNADFGGGATSFLSEGDHEEVCSVSPRAGTALIFNHDTLHEGQPVTEGTKYIIRTEVMFKRVDTEMLPNPSSYRENENYLKTVALYTKSWKLEQAGDVQGFTDTYMEGLALQCQEQRTVSRDTVEIFAQVLPYELFMKIFGYLSVEDLCSAMVVCKAWYTMCMDGQLWYQLYKRKWPDMRQSHHATASTNTTNLDPAPFTKDWYGKYKQRIIICLPKYQRLACVDLGSYSCKFALLNRTDSSITTSSVESVVALVPGVFDFHIRRAFYERYFCGRNAKEKYPDSIVHVIEKGLPIREELLPELIVGCFLDTNAYTKYCPVIILEPPGLWNDDIRARIAAPFLRQFYSPSVAYLSSAVAILAGMDMTCGVVLDIGREKVTCAAVYRGKQCPKSLSCDSPSATPGHLASLVERCVFECGENAEMKSSLKKNAVICTNEKSIIKDIRNNLIKRDKTYIVIAHDDATFAAVNGCCTYAMQKQYYKKFPEDHIDERRLEPFYENTVCNYWLRRQLYQSP